MNNTTTHNYYDFQEEDNIDAGRFLSLFISNWFWFAGAFIIAVVFAYGINRYSEKVYSVSASMLIKDDQIGGYSSSFSDVIPGGDIFRSHQNLVNEMGILRSYSLNYKVMEELPEFQVVYMAVGRRGIVETRMYKSSPFKVICSSLDSQPQGVSVAVKILTEDKFLLTIDNEINSQYVEYSGEHSFGERFNKFGFDFSIEKRFVGDKVFKEEGSNSYWFHFVGKEQLALEYKNKLSVIPIEEEASLVTLSVYGPNANQEADYLNKLMDVYIRYGLENKNQTADSTISFIENQLLIIMDSLALAEKKLEVFRKDNRFIDISSEGNYIQNRLGQFESEKATFELQLRYYQYLDNYLESKDTAGSIISPSVMGITDQVLLRLVSEFSEIQKQIAEVGYTLNREQSAYALINRQLEQTRLALKENVNNGLASLRLSIAEVNDRIVELEKDLSNLPSTERQLINIERDFDLNNTVYTYLLEKRSESEIARASNVSDNRIIDKAAWHSTSIIKPQKKKNILIALIFGLVTPALALIILDFLNDKILDGKDVERRTKVPVIGYISHCEGNVDLPVIEKPGSTLAESFRSIRTAIKYYVNDGEVKVIGVTSTISSEGKSFVSSNLAAIIAMLGKKVLLVGLDLRKPKLYKIFDNIADVGMSTYLSGNSTYEEVIMSTNIDNLFLAPAGAIPPNPSELIESERMQIFMDRAKDEFEYIIFDTPPIGIVSDTMLLAPYVNINLFIVRQRYSSRNTLDLIDRLHKQDRFKNMVIVINDIKLSGYYGYGIRYGSYTDRYGYNYYGRGYYSKYGVNHKTNSGYYTD
jgi:tyrosine-protein kinase Etk/Wzc